MVKAHKSIPLLILDALLIFISVCVTIYGFFITFVGVPGEKNCWSNRGNPGKESRNLALHSCPTGVYYHRLFLRVVDYRPSGFKRRCFMARYRDTFCF